MFSHRHTWRVWPADPGKQFCFSKTVLYIKWMRFCSSCEEILFIREERFCSSSGKHLSASRQNILSISRTQHLSNGSDFIPPREQTVVLTGSSVHPFNFKNPHVGCWIYPGNGRESVQLRTGPDQRWPKINEIRILFPSGI